MVIYGNKGKCFFVSPEGRLNNYNMGIMIERKHVYVDMFNSCDNNTCSLGVSFRNNKMKLEWSWYDISRPVHGEILCRTRIMLWTYKRYSIARLRTWGGEISMQFKEDRSQQIWISLCWKTNKQNLLSKTELGDSDFIKYTVGGMLY